MSKFKIGDIVIQTTINPVTGKPLKYWYTYADVKPGGMAFVSHVDTLFKVNNRYIYCGPDWWSKLNIWA